MGIKNLMKIIDRYAPLAISYNKIDKYSNKILAIDANLMLYKNIYGLRMNGYDLKNNDLIVTHIHTMILKLIAFKKYNITPVFVFDGTPPIIKNTLLEQRGKTKQQMKQKYDTAVTQDDKKKYYYMRSGITKEEIEDCKELINICGFDTINSAEESDSQLALLDHKGLIDFIVTDDMDILIFGGRNLLKNFTVSSQKYIQEINLQIILQETELSMLQFIDLALLLGCDYCTPIKGVGTFGAYKLIKEYGSIDNLIKNNIIKSDPAFSKAKQYFINPPTYNINKLIAPHKINIDKLTLFLKKFQFSDKYIEKIIKKFNT